MREIQLKRVYRHFKGDYYPVEDLAHDSETGELYVVYRSCMVTAAYGFDRCPCS